MIPNRPPSGRPPSGPNAHSQPPQPGAAGVAAANAAAQSAVDEAYQAQRSQVLVVGAGALLLSHTIAHGLPSPGDVMTCKASSIDMHADMTKIAFDLAEAFVAEAERRLGGKIPL